MTVNDVKNLLDASVVTGQAMLSKEVRTACGSDLMSDVLAYIKDRAVLLTGLINPQVISTADMMGIVCIVFVRGKTPDKDMVNLAAEVNLPVLATNLRMFEACGRLYGAGLGSGPNPEE